MNVKLIKKENWWNYKKSKNVFLLKIWNVVYDKYWFDSKVLILMNINAIYWYLKILFDQNICVSQIYIIIKCFFFIDFYSTFFYSTNFIITIFRFISFFSHVSSMFVTMIASWNQFFEMKTRWLKTIMIFEMKQNNNKFDRKMKIEKNIKWRMIIAQCDRVIDINIINFRPIESF